MAKRKKRPPILPTTEGWYACASPECDDELFHPDSLHFSPGGADHYPGWYCPPHLALLNPVETPYTDTLLAYLCEIGYRVAIHSKEGV